MHVTEIFVMGYIPIELCYECLCILSSDLTEPPPPPPHPLYQCPSEEEEETTEVVPEI
jgi:hypothetical protein